MIVPSAKTFGSRWVFFFPPGKKYPATRNEQEMSIKTESQTTELNPGCLKLFLLSFNLTPAFTRLMWFRICFRLPQTVRLLFHSAGKERNKYYFCSWK